MEAGIRGGRQAWRQAGVQACRRRGRRACRLAGSTRELLEHGQMLVSALRSPHRVASAGSRAGLLVSFLLRMAPPHDARHGSWLRARWWRLGQFLQRQELLPTKHTASQYEGPLIAVLRKLHTIFGTPAATMTAADFASGTFGYFRMHETFKGQVVIGQSSDLLLVIGQEKQAEAKDWKSKDACNHGACRTSEELGFGQGLFPLSSEMLREEDFGKVHSEHDLEFEIPESSTNLQLPKAYEHPPRGDYFLGFADEQRSLRADPRQGDEGHRGPGASAPMSRPGAGGQFFEHFGHLPLLWLLGHRASQAFVRRPDRRGPAAMSQAGTYQTFVHRHGCTSCTGSADAVCMAPRRLDSQALAPLGGDRGRVAGSWLLAAGCWLLAAGCWLLAAGSWLLASDRSPAEAAAAKHRQGGQQQRRSSGRAESTSGETKHNRGLEKAPPSARLHPESQSETHIV